MKVFYGDIFLNKKALLEAGIKHPIKLEYYKMINKETYGIKIIKTEYKKNNTLTEEKELKYLSNNEKIVDKILNLFKKYTVTPISAEEVVDDLLKQYF